MRLAMFARDGGAARRRAVRAGGVRRPRRCCSRAPTRVVRVGAHRAVRRRQPRRPGPAPLGRSGWRSAPAIGVGLLVARVVRRRRCCRARCGRSRSLLDMGGPFVFGAEGWKLVPGHFAERHGLIVIIALGESIVAIGVGAEAGVDAGVVVAAVLGRRGRGRAVVALLRRRRARRRAPAGERRARAASATRSRATPSPTCTSRWSPGIVLLALGLKKTLGARRRPAARSCRRSRCSAARRSTCSRTSRSAGATSTASARQRLLVRGRAASR